MSDDFEFTQSTKVDKSSDGSLLKKVEDGSLVKVQSLKDQEGRYLCPICDSLLIKYFIVDSFKTTNEVPPRKIHYAVYRCPKCWSNKLECMLRVPEVYDEDTDVSEYMNVKPEPTEKITKKKEFNPEW